MSIFDIFSSQIYDFFSYGWFSLLLMAIDAAIVVSAIFLLYKILSPKKTQQVPQNVEKEEKVVSEPKQPVKNTQRYIIPPASQFEQDIRTQIDKAVQSQLNGTVYWNSDCIAGVNNRQDFCQQVKLNNKEVVMLVKMSNDGADSLSFPGTNLPKIGLRKKPNAQKSKHKTTTAKPTPASKPKNDIQPTPPISEKSTAEKNGNVIINKDGKPEVKPNYRMIATDWINNNLEYLNKVCNDAMIANSDVIKALLHKDKLPPDKEAWEAIGVMLEEQEEIDSYDLAENGIIVTIN